MDANAIGGNATPDKGQPERRIRTFASDREILEKGGTPNLAPRATARPEPPAAIPAPIREVSAIAQNTVTDRESTEKFIRTFPRDTETLKEGGVPELVPLAAPKAPRHEPFVADPVPKKPYPEPAKAMPIKTYADDFSQRMKETHASQATVLAAEQDSATGAPQASPQKAPGGNLLYILAGSVLFIAGGVGAYFVYTRYLVTIQPIILAPSISAPIFVDQREQVSNTGKDLFKVITQSVDRPLASGAVRILYVAPATTTTESVFSALRPPAPGILLRNVKASGSMAGIVNVGGAQTPFFILSVVSYGDTFSGMLQWEPLMQRDLGPLFPLYPAPIQTVSLATSTAATSTQKTKAKSVATSTPSIVPNLSPILKLAFSDEVIANHDVRVYRDAAGRSILLYGYWNQTTLVIARDLAAFAEILQRLATSRTE